MNSDQKFFTKFKYTDRETKSEYVYKKYKTILKHSVLDVGADQCFLKKYLDGDTEYSGVGLGSEKIDLEIDLEKQNLPFKDNSFHTVLCLDVLEHLENIHDTFDELCRVSKKYVIISLPNPYKSFINVLLGHKNKRGRDMKFYGLPEEKPNDRHRWFFSATDAKNFIEHRAQKNNMDIIQIDGIIKPRTDIKGIIKNEIAKRVLKMDLNKEKLLSRTIWVVLEKNNN